MGPRIYSVFLSKDFTQNPNGFVRHPIFCFKTFCRFVEWHTQGVPQGDRSWFSKLWFESVIIFLSEHFSPFFATKVHFLKKKPKKNFLLSVLGLTYQQVQLVINPFKEAIIWLNNVDNDYMKQFILWKIYFRETFLFFTQWKTRKKILSIKHFFNPFSKAIQGIGYIPYFYDLGVVHNCCKQWLHLPWIIFSPLKWSAFLHRKNSE